MTRNLKYFITMFFILLLLCIIPNVVSAYEDTFTTEDGIVIKKNIDGYQKGSVHFDITNITLDQEKGYKWGISKSSNIENVENWYGLNDFTASQKIATIDLLITNDSMFKYLRENDIAYLYIKNADDDTIIVNALKLDLSLPICYAFNMYKYYSDWYITKKDDYWQYATYDIKNVYYKFEKITDENLVKKYKEAISNNSDLSAIIDKDETSVANETGWTLCDERKCYNKIPKEKLPTDQGVYYLYLKGKDEDTKTVYGIQLLNIDGDGPKVKSIEVASPNTGTYNTPQTVKIRVYFNEEITGTQMPTLKIKFGDSAERTLTDGTIHNGGSYSTYIEYSYNIQDSDKGQIATVSLEGGNIKDASGNEATLSCPFIKGSIIKANVDGTTNNNTDNKDQNNDQTTKPTPTPTPVPTPTQTPNNSNNTNNKPTPVPTNTPTNNGSSNNNSSQKDDTISNVKLPNTGAGVILIISIITIVAGGTIAYLKYNKYRDI